jgi:hypothetical protein
MRGFDRNELPLPAKTQQLAPPQHTGFNNISRPDKFLYSQVRTNSPAILVVVVLLGIIVTDFQY